MVVSLDQDSAYRCVVCYLRACIILVCVQVFGIAELFGDAFMPFPR